jgi:transcription elongation GreA/GreB family factor
VPTIKEWILIVAFVAFVLIPICWKFWKGWDRPSIAAVKEMKRRIQERDVREAFIVEDAKQREQQRLEAERELSLRKAQAPPPMTKESLSSAFGNLGNTDSTGTAILEGSSSQSVESIVVPVENVDVLVESLDIESIAEDVIPESAPVAVQLHGDASGDEVEWNSSTEEDDWSEVGW